MGRRDVPVILRNAAPDGTYLGRRPALGSTAAAGASKFLGQVGVAITTFEAAWTATTWVRKAIDPNAYTISPWNAAKYLYNEVSQSVSESVENHRNLRENVRKSICGQGCD